MEGDYLMYSNAGKSIKGCVKTIVTISMIAYVVVGIAIGIFVNRITGESGWLIGMLVVGVGCFLAWLSGLTLYAYGDMADRLKRIDEKLNGPDKSDGGSVEVPTEENGWTCAACYHVNFKNHTHCTKCGVTKSWSDFQWSQKNS